jgi:hypothetical protein
MQKKYLPIICFISLFVFSGAYFWFESHSLKENLNPIELEPNGEKQLTQQTKNTVLIQRKMVDSSHLENIKPISLPELNLEQIAALKNLTFILDKGEESPNNLLTPLLEWAEHEPLLAAEWVLNNLTGHGQQRAIEEVIAIWSATEPQNALAWLDKQKTIDGLEGTYANTISAFAQQDAFSAAEWLKQHPSLTILDNWEIIFTAWGKIDSSQALGWINENIRPDMKEALLPNLLLNFRDPQSREALISGSSPDVLESALNNAIKASSDNDPTFALKLAQQFQNEPVRQEKTNQILTQWEKKAPEAANAFITQNNLITTK